MRWWFLREIDINLRHNFELQNFDFMNGFSKTTKMFLFTILKGIKCSTHFLSSDSHWINHKRFTSTITPIFFSLSTLKLKLKWRTMPLTCPSFRSSWSIKKHRKRVLLCCWHKIRFDKSRSTEKGIICIREQHALDLTWLGFCESTKISRNWSY